MGGADVLGVRAAGKAISHCWCARPAASRRWVLGLCISLEHRNELDATRPGPKVRHHEYTGATN
eukprot:6121582-Alexandrium_andersonii.AAC.1